MLFSTLKELWRYVTEERRQFRGLSNGQLR